MKLHVNTLHQFADFVDLTENILPDDNADKKCTPFFSLLASEHVMASWLGSAKTSDSEFYISGAHLYRTLTLSILLSHLVSDGLLTTVDFTNETKTAHLLVNATNIL